jgi:hypothetical protein
MSFSDGEEKFRKRLWKSPVEAVPTPDKILPINGYFSKIAVLMRKKPCNLAGLYWAQKNGNNRLSGEYGAARDTMAAEKFWGWNSAPGFSPFLPEFSVWGKGIGA